MLLCIQHCVERCWCLRKKNFIARHCGIQGSAFRVVCCCLKCRSSLCFEMSVVVSQAPASRLSREAFSEKALSCSFSFLCRSCCFQSLFSNKAFSRHSRPFSKVVFSMQYNSFGIKLDGPGGWGMISSASDCDRILAPISLMMQMKSRFTIIASICLP